MLSERTSYADIDQVMHTTSISEHPDVDDVLQKSVNVSATF